MINIKLKLLLPMVRSNDGQKEGKDEGEIHSLGLCYHLVALSEDWTGPNV